MIRKSTYAAARAVASTIESHFAQQQSEARQRGELNIAPAPSVKVVEALIDAAFWASLRKEEGQSPRISLAFLPPELAGNPLLFSQKLPLTSHNLTKLAPGVERAGVHLGVWFEKGELYVWGTTREILSFCFVLDVSEPGLLVVKHRRSSGFGKFANVAVLKGDVIKIIDERSDSLPDCPEVLTSLLGFTSPSSWNASVNVLVQLAVSMRAHGKGGTLLVVPANSDRWRESVIHPMQYALSPAFSALTELMKQDKVDRSQSLWQGALRREIDGVAGLTAVDGATVINDQHEVLAFGAKILRSDGNELVEQIVVTEPVVGNEPIIIHPTHSGGTRHLSAAQFVHDQRDATALVASQDGRFTIFSWSPCEMMVHAHRVDTLLL
ncbi:putative sensor domain DACNV-containing protein [Rufibacter tibetensis]|uniref:Probable sensor domain-containing protein n=1 Tax=Rufibacter tibetensis TaxID=512763 RepID=A0A0P0CX30_9BACT|nr:hypothetical protein [Rufibacter tibetensis]ALI98948.1 hypothetical protein DC20_08105 [Rufibacter tibetensis]